MKKVKAKPFASAAETRAATPNTCGYCSAETNDASRFCPTCGRDIGCPNVRSAEGETSELLKRFQVARKAAEARGVLSEFDAFSQIVQTGSHVVVALPSLFAREFLKDPRKLYANYEQLTQAAVRSPAPQAADRERMAVGGKLFGSYAADIQYGALSLDSNGLANYGTVFAKLRDVAIQDRTSFLEENSYIFVTQHGIGLRDSIPRGHRSTWAGRGQLTAAKLVDKLTAGSNLAEWSKQMLIQGSTREDDRCVEAHIWGTFNSASIETISFASAGGTREEKLDIKCVKAMWTQRSVAAGGAA